MANTNGNDASGVKVASLRAMARNTPPPRDLWPEINDKIAEESSGIQSDTRTPGARARPASVWILATAATVSALAIGLWLGRGLRPAEQNSIYNPGAADTPDVLQTALVTDPRYLEERATLIASLERQLETLPPQTQTKVAMSLAAIRKATSDIQTALGRDPGSALLQELLVNTYRDEMYLLAAVHEVGIAGKEL